jgi:RimJ/RimL family protein N-acetyltransferase
MIFETKRLRVRKLNFSDINDFHKMQSDIEVMRYITGKAATYEESVKKLRSWICRYSTKKYEWPFAIELKENDNFIGICGIIEDNEIGFRFSHEHWGKGYGTEVLEGIIVYSRNLGLKSLIAEVIIDNEGSFKILKRSGFIIKAQRICKTTQLPEYLMQLEL